MPNIKFSPKMIRANSLGSKVIGRSRDMTEGTKTKSKTIQAGPNQRHADEIINGNLKQTLSDGVLLAELITTLTRTTVGNINREPTDYETKAKNLSRCLTHLQNVGYCRNVECKDISDGKPEALSEVLDSLIKLQLCTTLDHDQPSRNMVKVPKNNSHLPPPRKILHAKAASTSPVRGINLENKPSKNSYVIPKDKGNSKMYQKPFEQVHITCPTTTHSCQNVASGLPRPALNSNTTHSFYPQSHVNELAQSTCSSEYSSNVPAQSLISQGVFSQSAQSPSNIPLQRTIQYQLMQMKAQVPPHNSLMAVNNMTSTESMNHLKLSNRQLAISLTPHDLNNNMTKPTSTHLKEVNSKQSNRNRIRTSDSTINLTTVKPTTKTSLITSQNTNHTKSIRSFTPNLIPTRSNSLNSADVPYGGRRRFPPSTAHKMTQAGELNNKSNQVQIPDSKYASHKSSAILNRKIENHLAPHTMPMYYSEDRVLNADSFPKTCGYLFSNFTTPCPISSNNQSKRSESDKFNHYVDFQSDKALKIIANQSRLLAKQMSLDQTDSDRDKYVLSKLCSASSSLSSISGCPSSIYSQQNNAIDRVEHKNQTNISRCNPVRNTELQRLQVRAKSTEPEQCLESKMDCMNLSRLQRPTHLIRPANSTMGKNLNICKNPKLLSKEKARELYSLVKSRDERLHNFTRSGSVPISEDNVRGETPDQNADRIDGESSKLLIQESMISSLSPVSGNDCIRQLPYINESKNVVHLKQLPGYTHGSEPVRNSIITKNDDSSVPKSSTFNSVSRNLLRTTLTTLENLQTDNDHSKSFPVRAQSDEKYSNILLSTTDPEQLLSSLSKLTFDPDGGPDNFWDDNYRCLSDVESEYAALELILPNSSTDKSIANATQLHQSKSLPADPLISGGVEQTKIQRPATAMAAFPHRSHADATFPPYGTPAKLPIASVAPIMSTGRQVRGCSTPINLPPSTVQTNAISGYLCSKEFGPDVNEKDYMDRDETKLVSSQRSISDESPMATVVRNKHIMLEKIKLPYPNVTAYLPFSHTQARRSYSNFNLQHTGSSTAPPNNEAKFDRAEPVSPPCMDKPHIASDQNNHENNDEVVAKIEELTASNKVKDSQIQELHSTVNQLRNDINRKEMQQQTRSFGGPTHSAPFHGSPVNAQPLSQETLSMNSVTSGGSLVSHETNEPVVTSPSDKLTSAQPSEIDTNAGKRSRWIKPMLGKSIKKRSKSSLVKSHCQSGSLDRLSSACHTTSTIITGKFAGSFLGFEPLDHTYLPNTDFWGKTTDELKELRWKVKCLEDDNRKLRQFVLKRSDLLLDHICDAEKSRDPMSLKVLIDQYHQIESIRVHVFIDPECEQSLSLSSNNQALPRLSDKLHAVGYIGVQRNTTWQDVDMMIINLLQDYLEFIDQDNRLGLEAHMLQAYEMVYNIDESKSQSIVRMRPMPTASQLEFDPIVPKSNKKDPSQLLVHCLINGREFIPRVIVYLQHSQPVECVTYSNEISSLAFDTLIPSFELTNYVRIIKKNRITVLCGSMGTGKSKIVRKLAEYLSSKSKTKLPIFGYTVNANQPTEPDDLLTYIQDTITNVQLPAIILIEKLHKLNCNFRQLFEQLQHLCSQTDLVVMCTTDVNNSELEGLKRAEMIEIIHHMNNLDAKTNYISCSLRRKLANTYLTNRTQTYSEQDIETLSHLVTWLPKVWYFLHKQFDSPQDGDIFNNLFSMHTFLSCPMHISASLKWFNELWENFVIPFLIRVRPLNGEIMTHKSQNSQWMIPSSFEWIEASWPWAKFYSPPQSDRQSRTAQQIETNSIKLIHEHNQDHIAESDGKFSRGLQTFGVPKQQKVSPRKHQPTENRSSMDSGIVSDSTFIGVGPEYQMENPTKESTNHCFAAAYNITINEV